MDKVELAGTGLRRMREAMVAASLSPPKIRQTTFFTITFKRPALGGSPAVGERKQPDGKVTDKVTEKVTERVTENQSLILKGMKKDSHITVRILSEIVGISERKIKENIKLLKNKGLLKRIGPDRGGHWEVVDG
jgi:predicted HTH transcriptional regulator